MASCVSSAIVARRCFRSRPMLTLALIDFAFAFAFAFALRSPTHAEEKVQEPAAAAPNVSSPATAGRTDEAAPNADVSRRLDLLEAKLDRVLAELDALRKAESEGGSTEIRYQGKPLSAWIRDLADREPATSQAATQAIAEIGPDALPQVLEALTDKDWLVRRQAARLVGAIHPFRFHQVAALVSTLGDADSRVAREAESQLLACPLEVDGVVVLVGALRNESVPVRASAAQVLGQKAKEACGEVEMHSELKRVLAGEASGASDFENPVEADRRRELAVALEPAVPALVEALKDPEAEVRRSAAAALGGFGPGAAIAVEALASLASDSKAVRFAAATSAVRIGAGDRAGLFAGWLIEALKDRDAKAHCQAMGGLATLGKEARDAVPRIEQLLDSLPESLPAIGLERTGSGSDDQATRSWCVVALASISPFDESGALRHGDTVSILEETIRYSRDADLRLQAIRALGFLGPDAEEALPFLESIRGDATRVTARREKRVTERLRPPVDARRSFGEAEKRAVSRAIQAIEADR